MSRRVPFLKGHGTGNDFVLLPDPSGALDLRADDVALLCDRHRGLGADGVIRIAPSTTSSISGDSASSHGTSWFMDYRNADGSLAEMCGNGARVFLRALQVLDFVGPNAGCSVETRGGVVHVEPRPDGRIAVAMGHAGPFAVPGATSEGIEVSTSGGRWSAIAVQAPNPHAVVLLPGGVHLEGVDDLAAVGDLRDPPEIYPAFPAGANVEFVVRLADGSVRMRVHERGVGETRACGTGACAVAWTVLGPPRPGRETWMLRVHQPGGMVDVEMARDGSLTLVGEATIVAEGTVVLP